MSKYIPQINETNFVFPNYEIAEYDVDILHNINDLSVSGNCSFFAITGISSSAMTITYTWSWSRNGADVYISPSNNIHLVSVHGMVAGQTYYKPWRLLDLRTSATTGSSTYSGTNSFTITPSQLGVSSFINGTYYFELRFIGLKSIYPVCQTIVIVQI